MIPLSRIALSVLVGAAATVTPASALTLHTVTITPATSDRVFSGGSDPRGAAAANAYCLACHSVGMVMTQPDLTRDGWRAEVLKMRDAFKAPIPDDQISLIANYLYSIKGADTGAVSGDAS